MIRRFTTLALGLALVTGLAASLTTPASATTNTTSRHAVPGGHSAPTAASLSDADSDTGPTMVPPGGPGGYATVQAVLRYATGKRIGPSSYTGGGMFTITGFTNTPTGWARVRSAATCPSCTLIGADSVTPNGLPHWAEPWTWDWGHILGQTWYALWNKCLSGAVKGVVGSAGSTLLVNLIAAGGKVFVGPYGYAAIAIGGCMALALD